MKVCKAISKILIILLSVILGILLLFLLYIVINKTILKKKHPTIFGFSGAVVVSDSMVPRLKRGDLVIIKSQNNYHVGDIITFNDEIGLLTHRIVTVTENGYITKGDANESNDPEINKSEVLGKVKYTMDGMGDFINFFKKPIGIIIVTGSVILIVGFYLAISSWETKENNKKNVKGKD